MLCNFQGHADKKEERSGDAHSLRTRGQRLKLEVSFADMDSKTHPPANDDKAGVHCTRYMHILSDENFIKHGLGLGNKNEILAHNVFSI